MITNEQKEVWVEALRSGEYKQGKRALARDTAEGKVYCCLGVLAEQLGILREDNTVEDGIAGMPFFLGGVLPDKYLNSETQKKLTKMNDNGATFEDIAEVIENDIR